MAGVVTCVMQYTVLAVATCGTSHSLPQELCLQPPVSSDSCKLLYDSQECSGNGGWLRFPLYVWMIRSDSAACTVTFAYMSPLLDIHQLIGRKGQQGFESGTSSVWLLYDSTPLLYVMLHCAAVQG